MLSTASPLPEGARLELPNGSGLQHKVIYAYNHSNVYANTVLTVAEKLQAKPKKK